eukprot:TRINITY_DN20451_c0_g1_i2.p1 TRINITY_DN20451_c0_g1~~TRINITY_DN20451_c0_g1_i2.p1  ORF type:complete len:452 (+),score=161.41 TRINITY_DN20451_c0_g1_i2:76-1356(+)
MGKGTRGLATDLPPEAPGAAQWDQRRTLSPPPFTGPLGKLLKGLKTADPLYDALSLEALLHGVHHPETLPSMPDPDWVDWKQVARGREPCAPPATQELWTGHLSCAFLALAAALQQGFSIARFSEVLKDTGYNTDPHTTWERFQMTGFHVMDWWRFPLNDPQSRSRRSVQTVRGMHAVARRKALQRGVLRADGSEGVPLSQYDLAEVLMGFGIICLFLMKQAFDRDFSREDMAAMLSVMRVVGYHLGIEDQYNTCNSLDEAEAMFIEYMSWTPQRFRTCRESTHMLQYNVAAGFGRATPLGEAFWMAYTKNTSFAQGAYAVDYVRMEPHLGTRYWTQALTDVFRYNVPMRLASKALMHQRDLFYRDPAELRRRERIVARVASFSDRVTWPLLNGLWALLLSSRTRRVVAVLLLAILLLLRRRMRLR